MNSPWTRDVASSGFQWAYDNRSFLQKQADRLYLNKYRDYQEKTKKYKLMARSNNRRLVAKRALDFGKPTIPRSPKRSKFQIPYRGPNIDSKREHLHVEYGTVASKTLVGYLMSDIPLGAGNEDVFRQSSSIFVKGCKVRLGFRNLQGAPMMINVAVIAGKQANSAATTPSTENFFRNDGSNASERYLTFTSTNLSARQCHYLPINTEQWTVLHHTRKIINTTGDGDIISERANRGGGRDDFYEFNKWVPINRRLTYDTAGGNSCTTPIWIAFWVSRWDQTIAASPAANQVEAWLYCTTHFVG